MFKFVYITCLLIHFLQYNLYTAISWILCNKRRSQRCTIVSCHLGRYRILPPQSAFDCEPKTVQIFIPGPTWHDTMVFAESIFLILGWHTKNEGVKFKCKSFLMKPLKNFARSGWRVEVARWTKLKKFFPTSYIHDIHDDFSCLLLREAKI